jgi:hypothetical protein
MGELRPNAFSLVPIVVAFKSIYGSKKDFNLISASPLP